MAKTLHDQFWYICDKKIINDSSPIYSTKREILMIISVVVPLYNEQECLPTFINSLLLALDNCGVDFEIICVDDGSTDNSCKIINDFSALHSAIHLISFTRNFGHQSALTAGFHSAIGDAIICLDADGQHPPELIPEMIERWKKGAKIVQTIRISTDGEGVLKKVCSKLFYFVFKKLCSLDLHEGSADFRLVDREVLKPLLTLKEPPFWRAMSVWAGFPLEEIRFKSPMRIGGMAKYNFGKNLIMMLDAIFGYSKTPIYMLWALSLMAIFLGIISLVDAIQAICRGVSVRGWTSQMIVSGFLGGATIACLATIATYIERIHRIVMNRPHYIVKKK